MAKNQMERKDDMGSLRRIAEVVLKYENLKKKLKQEVIGQDNAVETIVNDLMNSEIYEEVADDRPRGIFLFAGTPGVGKTFLAIQLAEALGYPYLELNMSAYNSREDSKMALFGLDASWAKSKEGSLLQFVEEQEGRPCVLIFDEFEKAHPEVILQFLQILERGKTENVFIKGIKGLSEDELKKKGIDRKLLERDDETSFANTYLFFTTNAGRGLYENGKQPSVDMTKDVIIDAIRKDMDPVTGKPYFPDAILSRFQTGSVIMFRHLECDELIRIGRKVMEQNMLMMERYYDIKMSVEPEVATLLLLGEGGQVDARNYRKITENFVRTQVTQLCNSLKNEYLDAGEIQIGIDPEEREELNHLLYGDKENAEVIFVCEEERKLNLFYQMMKGMEGIKVQKTTDYDVAMSMIRENVYATPLIFAVLPPVRKDESLTMAVVNDILQARSFKKFADFAGDVRKYNERARLYVIDLEHSSEETQKDLVRKGVMEVMHFERATEVPEKIRERIDNQSLNDMAFDFARKGKALKYDIVPVALDDSIFVRLRYFEKVDNVKSDDADFLVEKERIPNVSFENVIGAEKIKEEAKDFIEFLKNPNSFVSKGLKAPKGLLLHGPAGTGKTFMAKAIAHEAGVPFIATNGGDIKMGRDQLNGAELLKKYFSIARKYAPSILFIDEMETIALNRTGADAYADTIVNTLLSEMDGFEGHDSNPVIVIGATNAGISWESNVDGRFLDPAVVRRFSRRFFVDLPLKKDRLDYLMKNTGLCAEELETTAQMSQGLSFGKMGNAIEIAKRLALREGRILNKRDVEEAIETENFGECRERSKESRERTAYHEAGHACLGCIYGGEHLPDHATIVSRGNFGGYVGTASDETGVIFTKDYLEKRIRIALAGRCAEIIHYGERDGLTAGPSSDIQSAYRMIVEMICHLGMDEMIGLTYYSLLTEKNSGMYCELPGKIQERVNELFEKYFQETMSLLTGNKALLEKMAQNLMQRESLGKLEIAMIMGENNG